MCSPCERIKKPCPGKYKGLFLINTSRASEQRPRCSNDASVLTESCIPLEPSQRSLFENAIVSFFISSFSVLSNSGQTHRQSWTQYLTSWISSSTAAWSVRAATLEFYGQQTKQEALCREAERYYAHALQVQQARIREYTQKPEGDLNKPHEAPTEEDVSASLMLMYYELLRPTFTGSWMTHLRGTVELLVLRGAQNCQQGLGHLVFRSLRLLMVSISHHA